MVSGKEDRGQQGRRGTRQESFVLVSGFRRKDLLEEGKEEGCLN